MWETNEGRVRVECNEQRLRRCTGIVVLRQRSAPAQNLSGERYAGDACVPRPVLANFARGERVRGAEPFAAE